MHVSLDAMDAVKENIAMGVHGVNKDSLGVKFTKINPAKKNRIGWFI